MPNLVGGVGGVGCSKWKNSKPFPVPNFRTRAELISAASL